MYKMMFHTFCLRWGAWKRLVRRLHEACGQTVQDLCKGKAALLESFPKFCALRGILEDRCERESDFHGMVFVRTRLVRSTGTRTHIAYVDEIVLSELNFDPQQCYIGMRYLIFFWTCLRNN